MVRIIRKGGVWKNHEDEVVKAAVMKYGKTQWARIASLLPKKTAAQCKERWVSWLDPSVKKTEWTKEEEEKLLHLAKIMPCRWRSIAPIVGRTPYQCVEHYERLLERAMGREGDSAEAQQSLGPGEADKNYEQKAPMPDAHDMSDDEKEMLNEARARLANTRGKKAKRKARAKQIEEARRLASVQKRRELREAGIEVDKRQKKIKGIDYAMEMPFFKDVPQGMFDTSGENKRQKQDDADFGNLDVQKAEGVMRNKQEHAARAEDKKKQLRKKEEDLAGHFEGINKKAAVNLAKKSSLAMPAPQVTDKDLHALRKLGTTAMEQMQAEKAGGKTERTQQVEDAVMLEAKNQAMMAAMQTPVLMGGETPVLNRTNINMPMPPGMTPGATPRDAVPATPSLYHTKAQELEAAQQAKRRKITGAPVSLDQLPAPTADVTIPLRMTEAQEQLLGEGKEKAKAEAAEVTGKAVAAIDAADATVKKKVKKTGQLLSATSAAVQRELPRPQTVAPAGRAAAGGNPGLPPALQAADALVEDEMRKLVHYDSVVHPMQGKPGKWKQQLQDFTPRELDKAAQLVKAAEKDLKQASALFVEESAARFASADDVVDGFVLADPSAVVNEMELVEADYLFVPNPPRILKKRECSTEDRLLSLRHEFDVTRNHTAKQVEAVGKVEKRAGLLTAGYIKRRDVLVAQLEEKWSTLEDAKTQLGSYELMLGFEQVALKTRTRTALDLVAAQKEKEASLQAQYADVMRDLQHIAEQEELKRKREEAAKADVEALAELEELENMSDAEDESEPPAKKSKTDE
eukprot:TRINITY_DN1899_c0_g1_i1.p1 TRINITY_DN1899_c0_g1~~TRINITY_DN1899_c0_g1_i1.p1  ORF type:complete len:801 (+),score=405.40 TRINITY_DN1899_c0_g1_i1:77-2479(+)